jgi:uncharacterized membrane-anchored protein YjiN (DUF445 family)
MVGALADWFAVTALFRYPMGLRIPHTNIIANRKDEIGVSLGEFVEENFLSDAVVRGKLESIGIANRLAAWLLVPEKREAPDRRVLRRRTRAARLLDDDDIKDLIESVAREHLLKPEWGPSIGRVGERLVASGQQHAGRRCAAREDRGVAPHASGYVRESGIVTSPSWMPVFVEKMVDERAFREAFLYLEAVRSHPDHPVRLAIDRYLAELAHDLSTTPGQSPAPRREDAVAGQPAPPGVRRARPGTR